MAPAVQSAAPDLLGQIVARFNAMPKAEQAKVVKLAKQATKDMPWVPNAGPQTQAYLSKADILLYGGQAGGGKTHLELGWGINEAESAIIFRRERNQVDGLEKEGKKIIGEAARFNGQDLEWTWPSGKTLKLAGMKDADSWMGYAGRERDYMGFDEGGEFLEEQVASLMAWVRAEPGRRTRVVIGSNPPRSAEGQWLLKWFAPWLDPAFSSRAAPGELRWAIHVTNGNQTVVHWMAGPGIYEIDGEPYTAKSYTFIPASLEDNPFRNTPEYRAQLQSLPEPLRSQLLYGDFAAGVEDAENQCIPTAWVRAAQARWTERPPAGTPMCALGVDCSGGGEDPMVIAPRYDAWFAKPVVVPGEKLPIDRMGSHSAGVVLSHRRDGAKVIVDMGGGYGGPLYEHLIANDVPALAYKGALGSTARTKDRQLSFFNKRTQAYWQFREALDPDQPNGSPVALPPDPEIVAELVAPTVEYISHKGAMAIKLEEKEKVCAKLGRSPNKADAIVMAWADGLKQQNVQGGFAPASRKQRPATVMGHSNVRRLSRH